MPDATDTWGGQNAAEAAAFLAKELIQAPRAAIITGTGLGDLLRTMTVERIFDYGQIPHFSVATVQSHIGRWMAGTVSGMPVALLQGRFHLYEGYAPQAIAFPVRVLRALGVQTVILTNAAGGLNPRFVTGDIMAITDHINLTAHNPLIGPNDDRMGPRFPDMTAAYDLNLRKIALAEALCLGFTLQQGVYVGLKGPSLETPAEMRFLQTIGADAVGFSTVLETIAAVHSGMQVLGLSIITNKCMPDAAVPADVTAIITAAQAAAPRLGTLIESVLRRMSAISTFD